MFDTLRVLVEHSGRLLTKHELMQQHLARHRRRGEQPESQHLDAAARARRAGDRTEVHRNGAARRLPLRRRRDAVRETTRGRLDPAPAAAPERSLRQEIRFCTATDGIRIAYSTVGTGPPLVKAANWLNHLEYEWESPVWKHWIDEISRRHVFVRYDERGCGLSDWKVQDLSFEAWVRDLETVVDALDVDRFDLLGISQGGAVAAAYAARHPERVNHLILIGGYALGWRYRGDAREIEARSALIKLVQLGWGRNNPGFRQIFTTRFIPDAGPEEMEWFNDLQQISASPDNAARLMEEFSRVDVVRLLGDIRVPTIVFHSDRDGAVPFNEGRRLAAGIRERGSFRCRAAIICCSSTSRRGRFCCESWAGFSGGALEI